MYYTLPGLIMIFTAMALVFMVMHFWRKKDIPGGNWFLTLITFTFFWALFGGMEEMVSGLKEKILFSKLTYLSIPFVSVVWFVFIIRFLEIFKKLRGYRLLLLWIIPFIVMIMAWTNEEHGLLWPEFTRATSDPASRLLYGTGPVKQLIIVYSYIFILISSVIVFLRMLRAEGVLKKQYLALLVSSIIPWVANILYITGIAPKGIEITPISFTVMVAAILWSMSRNNLFDLMPVAYDMLFRNMSDSAFVLDDQNRLVEINNSAQQVLHIQRESIGSLPESSRFNYPVLIYSFLTMEEGKTEFKMAEGASPKWFDVSVTHLTFRNGRNAGRLFVLRDITERKRLMEEFIKAKDMAEAASKAKSEFLATMSHEIRTPLNAIIGFTDLLKNTNLNAVQKEYVTNANVSGHALLDIINDILDFSKIEAGSLILEYVKTDMQDMLHNCVDIIRFSADKKKLQVLLDVDPRMPRFALIDPIRVKQILTNLLSNAVKFTAQGEVELKVRFDYYSEKEGKFTFSVRDTGIGIAESQKDKLFKAFSQADSSTTRKFGGTGLGLIISDLIAREMGSKIHFMSKAGRGSTFFFDLVTEAEDGEPIEMIHEVPETENLLSSGCKILLAEDVEMNLLMMQALLSTLLPESEVIVAKNGKQAVEMTIEHSPDLILMDVQMPEMDGIEATRVIRALEQKELCEIPIIALTAGVLREEQEKCLIAGMNEIMTKPINPDKFRLLLRKYL